MKRVILRVDDIGAHTDAADLSRLYEPCWEREFPVCFSVIPLAAYRFDPGGPTPAPPTLIFTNLALVGLLREQVCTGRAEITLHGWQHKYGEWAEPSDKRDIFIRAGCMVLRNTIGPVRVAVPPHDYLSAEGCRALRRAELGICSSWAAIHGGTRLAHWWRRFQRYPFAPAKNHLWPTDIDLLDFAGPEDDDWPVTLRLLRQAERWQTPVVFVQHPWRIQNQSDRWRRWLDRIAALPDVRFERFSDG